MCCNSAVNFLIEEKCLRRLNKSHSRTLIVQKHTQKNRIFTNREKSWGNLAMLSPDQIKNMPEYLNCISQLMSRICDMYFDFMKRITKNEDLEPDSFIFMSPV